MPLSRDPALTSERTLFFFTTWARSTLARSIYWSKKAFIRTAQIRTAIRNQLALHAQVVTETVTRRAMVLGMQHFSRQDLEAAQAAHEQLDIHVLGLASVAADGPPELAAATIASVVVLGVFHASPAVKTALACRIS